MQITGKFPFIQQGSRIKDLEQEIAELRATVNMSSATLDDFFKGIDFDSDTGITVGPDTALTLSAVWRAINIISQTISTLPISLYKKIPEGNREERPDHPAIELLRSPNELGSPIILKEALQTSCLTWGNGYAYIERNRMYKPISLRALDSEKVTPRSNQKKVIYDVNGLRDGISSDRILHIPGLSFDGLVGKSPIEVARNSLGGGLAVQRFGNKFFANGAKQTGVLMYPGSLKAEGRKNLRKDFEKNVKGGEGGTMILEEGMKYQPISIPPETAQFLQSRKFTVNEVARWFGVPPHLLFEEDRSTFNNIAEQGIAYVMYSLLPWVQRWQEELGRKLLTEEERKDHYFEFNLNHLQRGNPQQRAEAHRAYLDLGVMNINEVRNDIGLNDIPEGDKHLVQVARTPLDKIGSDGSEA